eukprot:2260742-Rhodomonas_salina.1
MSVPANTREILRTSMPFAMQQCTPPCAATLPPHARRRSDQRRGFSSKASARRARCIKIVTEIEIEI